MKNEHIDLIAAAVLLAAIIALVIIIANIDPCAGG
jgi:hypothetical protein